MPLFCCEIDTIYSISSSDGRDYVLGIALSDDLLEENKYYIFYFDEDDKPVKISEFYKKQESDGITSQFLKLHLLPNNDLLMSTYTSYPFENVFKTVSSLHRYSAAELGITTRLKEIEEDKCSEYKISPNLATNFIEIEGEMENISELSISAANGENRMVTISDGNRIQISDLSEGSYFLNIRCRSNMTKSLPFIKIR